MTTYSIAGAPKVSSDAKKSRRRRRDDTGPPLPAIPVAPEPYATDVAAPYVPADCASAADAPATAEAAKDSTTA